MFALGRFDPIGGPSRGRFGIVRAAGAKPRRLASVLTNNRNLEALVSPLNPCFGGYMLLDDDIQTQSVRKFTVALAVGLLLFGLGGLIGVRSPQIASLDAPQPPACCALVNGG